MLMSPRTVMSEKSILNLLSNAAILNRRNRSVSSYFCYISIIYFYCILLRYCIQIFQCWCFPVLKCLLFIFLTLCGHDQSGLSFLRWTRESCSLSISSCWSADTVWEESGLQQQHQVKSSKRHLTYITWFYNKWSFLLTIPPSSNSHQTSMVPLCCFFLNCWLAVRSLSSAGLRLAGRLFVSDITTQELNLYFLFQQNFMKET